MHKLLEPLIMPVLKSMTKGYVAGETLDDAIGVARDVIGQKHSVTICYWQADEEAPSSVAKRYAAIIKRLTGEGMDFHLSVKIPGLHEDMGLIKEVIENVRAAGAHADFDSHGTEKADDIFRASEMLGGERLGCAVPGRWLRSVDDARRAVGLGMRVRVVKGNWADPEAPEIDMREGYLKVIDELAGSARMVGVATHDGWLAEESFRRLKAAGTPFEQELLYGLPMEEAAEAGRKAGAPLRVYIPYGETWLPYSVSRALTNPRTMKWLARDLFSRKSFALPPPRDG